MNNKDKLIVNVTEAKAQLSALIERVLRGKDVIIGRAGVPVIRLVKYEASTELREPGALRGEIHMADDFDELPADIAEAFGMVTDEPTS